MSFILSEDAALKTKLQGITVSDEKVSSRSVSVFYANPDIEERNQSYPYITIELLDSNWDAERQTSGFFTDDDAQGTIEDEDGIYYTYEIPTAWTLMYQVTSYSRHPRHDRSIIAYILNRVFNNNRGHLPIQNDLGTETGFRHMFLQEFTKRDTIEDGRRLYRNVFTVSVMSEGSALINGPSPEVQTVEINTTTAHIPEDLQIP